MPEEQNPSSPETKESGSPKVLDLKEATTILARHLLVSDKNARKKIREHLNSETPGFTMDGEEVKIEESALREAFEMPRSTETEAMSNYEAAVTLYPEKPEGMTQKQFDRRMELRRFKEQGLVGYSVDDGYVLRQVTCPVTETEYTTVVKQRDYKPVNPNRTSAIVLDKVDDNDEAALEKKQERIKFYQQYEGEPATEVGKILMFRTYELAPGVEGIPVRNRKKKTESDPDSITKKPQTTFHRSLKPFLLEGESIPTRDRRLNLKVMFLEIDDIPHSREIVSYKKAIEMQQLLETDKAPEGVIGVDAGIGYGSSMIYRVEDSKLGTTYSVDMINPRTIATPSHLDMEIPSLGAQKKAEIQKKKDEAREKRTERINEIKNLIYEPANQYFIRLAKLELKYPGLSDEEFDKKCAEDEKYGPLEDAFFNIREGIDDEELNRIRFNLEEYLDNLYENIRKELRERSKLKKEPRKQRI